MSRFLLSILSLLYFLCGESHAKVAPPDQVSNISFEWGGAQVELSLYIEPLKKPHIRTARRQSYWATVHTVDGKKKKLQEDASPISPSREADVQMIRYGRIRAVFSVGQETPHVQLGKDARVYLYSPRVNEPIIVRTRGLNIRFHMEISDGKESICATITPRKGKPRTVRRLLWKTKCGIPSQIVSIEPGVMQPENELYLTLQVGAARCILHEDGSFIMCQPPVNPSEIDNQL